MKTSRLVTVATAAALVASLCVPAAALAAPGNRGKGLGRGQGLMNQQGGGQGQGLGQQNKQDRDERLAARLGDRIAAMLARRDAKFDAAVARLRKRITRLRAIAARAEAKGAVVTSATVALDKAETDIETAIAEEAKAVALFEKIPGAADKRAAFAAARAQARVAQKALQRARLQVVRALQALHKAVDEAGVWSPNATVTVSPTP